MPLSTAVCPTACPPAACSALDEGTNPDTFTVQVFRDSLAQNQARCVCAGRAWRLRSRLGIARRGQACTARTLFKPAGAARFQALVSCANEDYHYLSNVSTVQPLMLPCLPAHGSIPPRLPAVQQGQGGGVQAAAPAGDGAAAAGLPRNRGRLSGAPTAAGAERCRSGAGSGASGASGSGASSASGSGTSSSSRQCAVTAAGPRGRTSPLHCTLQLEALFPVAAFLPRPAACFLCAARAATSCCSHALQSVYRFLTSILQADHCNRAQKA